MSDKYYLFWRKAKLRLVVIGFTGKCGARFMGWVAGPKVGAGGYKRLFIVLTKYWKRGKDCVELGGLARPEVW